MSADVTTDLRPEEVGAAASMLAHVLPPRSPAIVREWADTYTRESLPGWALAHRLAADFMTGAPRAALDLDAVPIALAVDAEDIATGENLEEVTPVDAVEGSARDDDALLLRRGIEHAPAVGCATAPGLIGIHTLSGHVVCARCVGRLYARGVSVPRHVQIWHDDPAASAVQGSCLTCTPE